MSQICTHLDQILVPRPDHVAGCEDCLKIGGRGCICGCAGPAATSGAAIRSPNRHATHHVHESGHPIVTSVEPGEDWSYCYVDEAMFVVQHA